MSKYKVGDIVYFIDTYCHDEVVVIKSTVELIENYGLGFVYKIKNWERYKIEQNLYESSEAAKGSYIDRILELDLC